LAYGLVGALAAWGQFPGASVGQEAEKPPMQEVVLAKGALRLSLPAAWKKTPPKSQIIDSEFALPPAEGDAEGGRLTIMAAGGGIEGNLSRWISQFRNPAGGDLPELPAEQPAAAAGESPKEPAAGKRTWKRKAGALDAHLIDLRGTYADRPQGPFGPAVDRDGFRMLGLILPTPQHGMWFVKLYGPQKTINAAAAAFEGIADSVQYQP
jgi:hypothetical protein